MSLILAIESSCDETSVAILKDEKELLANVVSTQIAFHQKYGGVIPELASRLHIEKITVVINEALEQAKITMDDITHIAVTRGPGLIGALHVGLQAAKTLALIYNKPLIGVHHLAGHIYANKYVTEFRYPLLALIVSGGNTELVYMKDELDFQIIGRTLDDAIGEAYDKVARLLDLGYPGGPIIDKLAKEGNPIYNFPHPKVEGKYNFSYSGVKTSVLNMLQRLKNNNQSYEVKDIACSFQKDAVAQLIDKTLLALKEYDVKQVIVAGGVSANSYLREEMKKNVPSKIELVIPPLWATTDNAAMIAKAAVAYINKGLICNLEMGVDPNWELEDCTKNNK
ncbi:MAG: tRNA (adenosine(37)-N6)-threonylcarbamoyltransferase complex transferase subunit TsaD [Erysipelotrichaceae bacterium]|nr:tRNA (adenosine(37)-N6)-threonylcarbamoyltransferase complex transferase subunit TsaD [Erysipelotrichaceae bacterium]